MIFYLLLVSSLFIDNLKGMEEPNLVFLPLSLILLQGIHLDLQNSEEKLENRDEKI